MNEIEWEAVLEDGTVRRDSLENGSWRFLNGNISKLRILSQKGQGKIDDNKDGYFIGNKIIYVCGGKSQELAGIGYWSKGDPLVRVKWYNKEDMQLSSTEVKPVDQCEGSLRKNEH